MQELIDRLKTEAGISEEQATKSLNTIKSFVKEKFPMLGGAVDNMFAPQPEPDHAQPSNEPEKKAEPGILDKISDLIPGATGEKVEEFAKNAAHKAEDVFEGLKEKLSGIIGGEKK